MFPSIEKTELYTGNANTVAHLMAGSSDQMKEQLKAAQEEEQEAKRLLATGEHVLQRVREDVRASCRIPTPCWAKN